MYQNADNYYGNQYCENPYTAIPGPALVRPKGKAKPEMREQFGNRESSNYGYDDGHGYYGNRQTRRNYYSDAQASGFRWKPT